MVKKAPEEGIVMRMTEPMPWYRPRKRVRFVVPLAFLYRREYAGD